MDQLRLLNLLRQYLLLYLRVLLFPSNLFFLLFLLLLYLQQNQADL
jgi:hypothetical protein